MRTILSVPVLQEDYFIKNHTPPQKEKKGKEKKKKQTCNKRKELNVSEE